ncbi:hypothetical protein AGDE_06116 [Angomonas deanei]|uniref:Tetratricopeptide repeat, putative n=1 Tax=Angomonas deanei TaxID=59799 RepID=A0A7G2CMG0_9TRYP|nr:hypothetical protein AGDE_06116 [Angomonas deanei]CAD2220257.1 Tetratricopeptide repeat, putative [Angomonas deanei]|eukprot:EPY37818.1 hypothetical protein AGDE_06116 [Angomonas deanei]
MMVYQKEGDIYHKQGELESAKDTYSRAITLAERRVARGEKDVYMVLKRYVLSMVGLARIWYQHEKEIKGFKFVDAQHPRVPAVEGDGGDSDLGSISSLESSLSSAGSIFSLNEAILRAMAPREPRSRTGPKFSRVKVNAPHQIKETQLNNREDQFVLHSKMTRELIASPCELLLLRCCEVVELGHNCQSELMIPALIELAQIYEDLELYSRALLLVRRCLGILCNVYDYDHPWVIELQHRADRLNALLEQQMREEAATKIQATWKMHKAMRDLEDALGHPVKRHVWIPRKYRTTPDLDFLGDLEDLPVDNGEPDDDVYVDDLPDNGALVPVEPNLPAVVYNPVESQGEVVTFTTMVPNAKVLGTTQDTETDTHIEQTDLGDILTIRTTTVTRTLTENVDDEEDVFEELGPDDSEEPSLDDVPRVQEIPDEPYPPRRFPPPSGATRAETAADGADETTRSVFAY